MDINVDMFHHIPMAYLERRALHPHTCCGLLITQDYIQMLWFFIHQSCMKLVIMRLCMGIQTQNINCSVKKIIKSIVIWSWSYLKSACRRM